MIKCSECRAHHDGNNGPWCPGCLADLTDRIAAHTPPKPTPTHRRYASDAVVPVGADLSILPEGTYHFGDGQDLVIGNGIYRTQAEQAADLAELRSAISD